MQLQLVVLAWCVAATQAQICQKNYNDTVACTKRPYCVWMYDAFDKRKVCQHRDSAAAGTDAYSKAFYQMKVRSPSMSVHSPVVGLVAGSQQVFSRGGWWTV